MLGKMASIQRKLDKYPQHRAALTLTPRGTGLRTALAEAYGARRDGDLTRPASSAASATDTLRADLPK